MFSTSVRWLERGCLSDSMRRQLRPWWWHRRRNNKKSPSAYRWQMTDQPLVRNMCWFVCMYFLIGTQEPWTVSACLSIFWQESRRLGHNYVGTEMLLVGVVADTSGPSGKVLKKFNVTLKDGNLVCQAEISSWFLFAAFTCNLVCRKTWPHLTPRDFIWFPGYYIYIYTPSGKLT